MPGGFRREVQPRRQHWFLNEKSGFPFRTPAFCSASRGRRRLGEKEYRAASVTPGVALRPRTQAALILDVFGGVSVTNAFLMQVVNDPSILPSGIRFLASAGKIVEHQPRRLLQIGLHGALQCCPR
jgi:hypothetical protein